MDLRPLPSVAGRFVGRRGQLRAIEDRLVESRVVTLLGPPGIGKTRCALAFASGARTPSVFVELAHARTEADALSAVGRALGLSSARSPRSFAQAIGTMGEALVLLDNAEHVAPALAPLLRAWLAAAPASRFLLTSLVRLGIEEESCVELGGLDPVEALELFEDHARRVGAERLDAVWTARLLERLEGVPLAIELAAARTRILSPRQLLSRLDQGLDVLRGRAGRPERHRSLQESIRCSWELLEPEEAAALVQASVFVGGFTLEAAEAVMGTPASTLDRLERLRDKSFLRLVTHGEPRFQMLESLRLFAQDRPELRGELEDARSRHARYFISRADRGIDGAPDTRQLAWMLAEEENLRAAHGTTQDHPALRARACLALAVLYSIRGPVEQEAERLEEGLVAARQSGDAWLSARLARALGVVLLRQGELASARRLLEEALASARASERPPLALHAEIELGRLRFAEGAWGEARRLLGARIEIAQRFGAGFLRGYALNLRGMAAEAEGDLLAAAADFEAALDSFDRADNCRYEAIAGLNLGVVRANMGRMDDAAHRFERAAASFRRIEDRARETDARLNLGTVRQHQGRLEEAEPLLQEGLAMERYIGNRRGEAMALDALAKLSFEKEEFERALDHSRACRELCRKGDLRHALGVHLPFGAAIEAVMGNRREAEEDFAEARRLAASASDPLEMETWRILYEFLSLGEGRRQGPARRRLEQMEAKLRGLAPGRRRADFELALRWLRRGLSRQAAAPPPSQEQTDSQALSIGPEGAWFQLGSLAPVDLSKRRAPRLILRALVERRLAAPGVGLSVERLAEAGWPGDRGQPTARAARVYVAVHALRSLGLGQHLLRQDGGYLLDPSLELRRPPPLRQEAATG